MEKGKSTFFPCLAFLCKSHAFNPTNETNDTSHSVVFQDKYMFYNTKRPYPYCKPAPKALPL